MKGNTIHAGPPSDKRNCRVIFFYAASPTPITSLYEPDNQWNQVTLVSAILVDIWRHIPPIEWAVILEYIQCIQSGETIAPSDTCLFVTNFTLRLFIRISLFLPSPHASNIAFQWKYVNFLHQLCNKDDISPAHQVITKKMVRELDPKLLDKMFKFDEKDTSYAYFLFK
jgi:hypothetical protein